MTNGEFANKPINELKEAAPDSKIKYWDMLNTIIIDLDYDESNQLKIELNSPYNANPEPCITSVMFSNGLRRNEDTGEGYPTVVETHDDCRQVIEILKVVYAYL